MNLLQVTFAGIRPGKLEKRKRKRKEENVMAKLKKALLPLICRLLMPKRLKKTLKETGKIWNCSKYNVFLFKKIKKIKTKNI